jgi:hypothetical protein
MVCFGLGLAMAPRDKLDCEDAGCEKESLLHHRLRFGNKAS